MGLGFTEMLFIVGTIALLFGPGAVLVWWFMSQARAGRSAEEDVITSDDPVLAAAARSLTEGEITQEQYDEIERTLGT